MGNPAKKNRLLAGLAFTLPETNHPVKSQLALRYDARLHGHQVAAL